MAAVRSRSRKPAVKVDAKKNPTPEPAKLNVLVLPAARVELCAAKGDLRYYLNWPYLDLRDKKRPMLVATNGHILAAAPVEIEGDVKEGPIPAKAIQAARAVKTKQPQAGHRLIFDGDMCGTGEVMYRRPSSYFKFPDWREVVPKLPKDTAPDIGLNGDYITTLQNVMDVRRRGWRGLKLTMQRDEQNALAKNKGLLVRGFDPDLEGVVAVLMPMHV